MVLRSRFISLIILQIIAKPLLAEGISCPHPETDINTKVNVESLSPKSSATYSCDSGYEVFGNTIRTCGEDGKWSGKIPKCVTNVAWRKPVNQSSTARGGNGENANDGDKTTVHDGNKCSQTAVEDSPWWAVDLLQEFEVTAVRITTRGCCGQEPIKDLEVRVGDSPDLQRNRLCAWDPGPLEEGITKELECARPIVGRYIFLQMAGVEGSLSLCEVEVFSREQFSKDRCKGEINVDTLGIFNQTCYEFQVTNGGAFSTAKASCQNLRRGTLVNNVAPLTQKYLVSELERHKQKMKTKMVWIGVQKEPQLISRIWRWIDGTEIKKPTWGRDQPNNYNGEQNCVVLDGSRNWLWNDVGCNLNYLFWICQFAPSCGSPNKRENTTYEIIESGDDMSAIYSCPIGNKVIGDKNRTCLTSGHWTGTPPTCTYIDCGDPKSIEHGEFTLVDSRTTFEAKTQYICNENYAMKGEDTLTCGENHQWNPKPPQCLYSWCPELDEPKHSSISLSGRRAGDTATFTCERGYSLIGHKTLSCQLGGEWSHETPRCRFVDCGQPAVIENGEMSLVNGTILGSEAIYSCRDDHILEGLSRRVCEETGFWSGKKPVCKLINCGEPDIPVGGRIIGDVYDIHSEVEYQCEEGHFMLGDSNRRCLKTAKWSGVHPTCTYVDCKTPLPLIRGEIKYLGKERTTYLGSQIEYSCLNNFHLSGPQQRVCQRNGHWSGTKPKCLEIRCQAPEQPEHGEALLSSGDPRLPLPVGLGRFQKHADETYKVGAEIVYRCKRGFAVQGVNLRICLPTGNWSDEAPSCKFVDCGLPAKVENGSYRLLSNETSVGAAVLYECNENFKIQNNYRRQCQEGGDWSGNEPKCIEIQCPSVSDELSRRYKVEDERPIDQSNHDMVRLIEQRNALRIQVEDGNRRIGSSAKYFCSKGQKIFGKEMRQCGRNGVWLGREPKCQWITCPRPDDIENGRIHILSEDLKHGSVIEYFCLPKFRLEGPFNRTCTEDGRWSGRDPLCTIDDYDRSLFGDNTVDGTTNLALGPTEDQLEGASYTGIYVGIAVSLILIFGVGLAFLFLRARQKKVNNDSPSPSPRMKPGALERPAPMTYGDLNDPTTGNNIYEHIPEDVEVSSYANMSPTSSYNSSPPGSYTNSHQHTYSNSSSNGTAPTYLNSTDESRRMHSNGRIPYHISQRPRMPPPQPPDITGVTINGVAVNSSVT